MTEILLDHHLLIKTLDVIAVIAWMSGIVIIVIVKPF
jgi:uncharacterized membrane protein